MAGGNDLCEDEFVRAGVPGVGLRFRLVLLVPKGELIRLWPAAVIGFVYRGCRDRKLLRRCGGPHYHVRQRSREQG